MFSFYVIKGTVQRKLTGVLSGINRKLLISSIAAGYFFLNLKGLVPLNLLFSVLINFRVAFLDNVAHADKVCCAVTLHMLYQ
jgi:hypothetical protein